MPLQCAVIYNDAAVSLSAVGVRLTSVMGQIFVTIVKYHQIELFYFIYIKS